MLQASIMGSMQPTQASRGDGGRGTGRREAAGAPAMLGLVLAALLLALLAALHDEPWQVVVAMAGLSVGVGFAFAAMAALITEAVAPTETGIATGINTVMRTVGAVVGAQVGAAILTASTVLGTTVPNEQAYVSAFALSAVANPFAAQNAGAGRMERVRAGLRASLLFCAGFGGAVALALPPAGVVAGVARDPVVLGLQPQLQGVGRALLGPVERVAVVRGDRVDVAEPVLRGLEGRRQDVGLAEGAGEARHQWK